MKIGYGMMMQPYFKKVHEYLPAWSVRFEQLISLYFPLFAQLVRYLLHENRVFIESILILLIFEKGEIGVIENLILFFPEEVILCLLGGERFASAGIIFVLQHEDSSFLI